MISRPYDIGVGCELQVTNTVHDHILYNMYIYMHDLNQLETSRLTILLLLSLAVHATFLVEQPSGSDDVFPNHPRFSWFCNRVARVPFLRLLSYIAFD